MCIPGRTCKYGVMRVRKIGKGDVWQASGLLEGAQLGDGEMDVVALTVQFHLAEDSVRLAGAWNSGVAIEPEDLWAAESWLTENEAEIREIIASRE